MQRLFNRIKPILIGFCLFLGLLFIGASPAQAQNASELPVVTDSAGQQTPAWDRVSFSSLPAFDSAGVLDVPEDATGHLDYDLSRSWQAGDSVLSVLKLGDVQDAFALGNFRLGDVVRLGGLDPATLSLSNFSVLQNENIADLVSRIPAIGNFRISEVRPLYDLITQRIPNIAQTLSQMGNFRVWSEQPIATLAKLPDIGNLSLNNLDLSKYSFTQLPGLEQASLSSIRDWKNLNLAQIPGLGNVPFSAFFNPGQFLGLIAIHDVTYGGDTAHKESRSTPTKHSITGSYEVGFNYECAQARGCDYLELNSPISLGTAGDLTGLHGARWIRGGGGSGEQMVKGGHGVLGMFNGGQEPTGRHPFGSAFKVVLTNTDESTGTGRFGLYFRVCHRTAFVDLGCTPYFIGPVPWFPTHEKGIVLVGLTEMLPPSGIQEPEIPQEIQNIINQYDPPAQTGVAENDSSLCGAGPGNIDWNALSSGITAIESIGNTNQPGGLYGTVGEVNCDRAGCMVPLGRYQFMSFREDLRPLIARKPGGTGFLQRMDGGYRPSASEVLKYFPQDEQDALFKQAMTQDIQKLNARGVTGEAMVACLGEIWYHGLCDHSSQRDYIGGPTVAEYGQRALAGYRQTLSKNGTKSCSIAGGNGKAGITTGSMVYPEGINAPITGVFGENRGDHTHKGVDFAEPIGSPIKAADGGVVEEACMGCDPNGYGSYIVIRHGNRLETLYGHPSKIYVKKGQPVAKGQVIGAVGQEGDSTGQHLHFEVIRDGIQVNPMPYLRK